MAGRGPSPASLAPPEADSAASGASTRARRPPVPKGLGTAGKATWAAVWAELDSRLELDERERLILREACGVADDLDRLDRMLTATEDEKAIVRVLSERRQQRLAYGRLLAQLDLGGAQTSVRPSSRRASHAARARWGA